MEKRTKSIENYVSKSKTSETTGNRFYGSLIAGLKAVSKEISKLGSDNSNGYTSPSLKTYGGVII